MASRTLFQMDQATSAHQKILRNERERREDASLDRDFSLCPRCDPQKTSQVGSQSLHNSTDFKRQRF